MVGWHLENGNKISTVMNEQTTAEIEATIKQYFEGIYYGNVQILQQIFHPRALLIGEVKGQPYFKTVDEYLSIVQNRKSPHASGEAFKMKIISIERVGAVAYARLHCPMLGYNYYDFIALCQLADRWLIMNKLFTHQD
jgi:hypothetical protein